MLKTVIIKVVTNMWANRVYFITVGRVRAVSMIDASDPTKPTSVLTKPASIWSSSSKLAFQENLQLQTFNFQVRSCEFSKAGSAVLSFQEVDMFKGLWGGLSVSASTRLLKILWTATDFPLIGSFL